MKAQLHELQTNRVNSDNYFIDEIDPVLLERNIAEIEKARDSYLNARVRLSQEGLRIEARYFQTCDLVYEGKRRLYELRRPTRLVPVETETAINFFSIDEVQTDETLHLFERLLFRIDLYFDQRRKRKFARRHRR